MKKMPYVCLYSDYLESLAHYSDAQRGRLYTALLQYLRDGSQPEFKGSERYIWPSLQYQLDRDMATYADRCETNRINGEKGGRPRKDTSGESKTEGFSGKPKKAKEKENENEKENEKEKTDEDTLADKPPARSRFSPPSEEDVLEYITRMGYSLDAGQFMDYYTSNGWRVGRNPMKDWKAAVRTWNRKEGNNGKTEAEPEWDFGVTL